MPIPNPAHDPFGPTRQMGSLGLDPTSMLARSMLGSGPIGSLLDRIERALDARDAQRVAPEAGLPFGSNNPPAKEPHPTRPARR